MQNIYASFSPCFADASSEHNSKGINISTSEVVVLLCNMGKAWESSGKGCWHEKLTVLQELRFRLSRANQ